MKGDLRVIFAGGGTGGHLFPAINIARFMKKKLGAQCLFIGTDHGIEKIKVPQAGFAIRTIWISGFHRRLTLKNLIFPVKLWVSSRQSRKIINEFKPDLVIGTGGYVSGPVLRQAIKMKIPSAIQEQNSYPGVTTRMLAANADRVFLADESAMDHLPQVKNYRVIGNPLREVKAMPERAQARKVFDLHPKRTTLFVFGGSQGAKSINHAVDQLLQSKKLSPSLQLIWQTGQQEFDEISEKYKDWKEPVIRIYPFIDTMPAAYVASDLAICRAGAMTVAELKQFGVAALLIPYPHAAADHQMKNARSLEKKGAARVLKDDGRMAEYLQNMVHELIADSSLISGMSEKMKALYQPDATEKIVDELIKLLKETNKI